MNPTMQINLQELTPLAAFIFVLALLVNVLLGRKQHSPFIRAVSYFFMACAAVLLLFGLMPPPQLPSDITDKVQSPVTSEVQMTKSDDVIETKRTRPQRDVRYEGVVLDQNNLPIAKAVIEILGTSKYRVVTEEDGSFTLSFKTSVTMTESVLVTVKSGKNRASYYHLALDNTNMKLSLP